MAEQLTGLGFKPRQSHVSILLGVTLRWTSISSGGAGGVVILLGMLCAKETWISSGHLGPWLVCTFTLLLS